MWEMITIISVAAIGAEFIKKMVKMKYAHKEKMAEIEAGRAAKSDEETENNDFVDYRNN